MKFTIGMSWITGMLLPVPVQLSLLFWIEFPFLLCIDALFTPVLPVVPVIVGRGGCILRSTLSTKMSNDDAGTVSVDAHVEIADSLASTATATATTDGSWSVTDNWDRLSQSDNINYNYGESGDTTDEGLVVLNSIDQATLAALRMQNFGMSTSSQQLPLSEEEEWIQNSIQRIVTDDIDDVVVDPRIAATQLDTEQFLDEMGKEIAMLIRCNDNDPTTTTTTTTQQLLFMDECEILEETLQISNMSTITDKQGKSSYERVELHDGIPIWMKDGEFVFIDEQSCIGCMQCAAAAPGSFQMLEQGRARAFCQRNSPDVSSAVASCPVDCMHHVSFDELKELEIARDVGVADDHRHFGHSSTRGYIPPTPLHISRRDSDANHKSSFYHFIQDKCSKSTNCPQRGCYDCPKFAPGKNPYFQEKLSESTHVRAEYFKETGTADVYRKTADL